MADGEKRYLGLRNPWHQPDYMMCIPTCLKTVVKNQYPGKRIPFNSISKRMSDKILLPTVPEYTGYVPLPPDEVPNALNPYFNKRGLQVNIILGASKKNLIDLIDKGIYPLVFLEIRGYFKYIGVKVSDSTVINSHCIAVTGYDEDNESYPIYCPIDKWDYRKDYDINELKTIDYINFAEMWNQCQSRLMWVEEKAKGAQRTLLDDYLK